MAKKKRKKGGAWKVQILLISFLFSAVLFSQLAIIAVIGMVPTFVSAIVDHGRSRIRALTIGAVNFAGCAPFMIEVWKKGGGIDMSLGLILQPRTIVIMYFAAGLGYLIDWAVTGIVSSMMVQRSKARVKEIEKQQKDLVTRWGAEVTGTIPLDEYGFPIENFAPRADEAPST